MQHTYNRESTFEIVIEEIANEVVQPVVEPAQIETENCFPPIYENPDKFFVYFLSKVKV